jgi:hypothetical protein
MGGLTMNSKSFAAAGHDATRMKEADKKRKMLASFSQEERDLLKAAFRRTWQIVGGEFIELLGKGYADWEEAMEACADADRLRDGVERNNGPDHDPMQHVVSKFYELDWDAMQDVFLSLFGKVRWG